MYHTVNCHTHLRNLMEHAIKLSVIHTSVLETIPYVDSGNTNIQWFMCMGVPNPEELEMGPITRWGPIAVEFSGLFPGIAYLRQQAVFETCLWPQHVFESFNQVLKLGQNIRGSTSSLQLGTGLAGGSHVASCQCYRSVPLGMCRTHGGWHPERLYRFNHGLAKLPHVSKCNISCVFGTYMPCIDTYAYKVVYLSLSIYIYVWYIYIYIYNYVERVVYLYNIYL